jgi:hypothetical protein
MKYVMTLGVATVAPNVPVAIVVRGTTVHGTITELRVDGIDIRIDDGSNRTKSISVPHFAMAVRKYAETGMLSKEGRDVAERLLRELYESPQQMKRTGTHSGLHDGR